MKKKLLLPFILMGFLTFSTPSCSNINWDNVKATTHTVVSDIGVPLLTAGAVEALVYKAIKANPESQVSFTESANILTNASLENVLSTEDIRKIVKNHLFDNNSKYRTYTMLTMDIVFNMMKNNENKGEWDITEYRTLVDAIITGIYEAERLYNTQTANKE